MEVQVNQVSRAGSGGQDSEDAVAHATNPARFALADGASTTFDPRSWAQKLAEAFVAQPPPFRTPTMHTWASILGGSWRQALKQDDLPWYAQEKARRDGSAATLVGLEIGNVRHAPRGWRAIAVGDSILLHIREGRPLTTFPLQHPSQFGATPPLISTDPEYNRKSLEHLCSEAGECRSNDLFLLASDALGEWLLRRAADQPRWLRFIQNLEEDFETRIRSLQDAGEVELDDATLVTIRIR